MKSYLSLVPISAKVHRRQSRMTRVCIILAVFLVTSIFSMTDMMIRAEQAELIKKHGNYHIRIMQARNGQADQIRKRPDVAVLSEYGELNVDVKKDYRINDKNAVLYGVEQTWLTEIMNYPSEGSYPAGKGEIGLGGNARELLGVGPGDRVVLHTPGGELDFTVSALYEDDAEFNDMIDGCCVYLNRTAFEEICALNGEDVGSEYFVRFTSDADVKRSIADIRERYGSEDGSIRENTAVLGLTGASSNETVKNVYPLALVCFLLILISGVLMISGCMNSNVAQRTSFFGMMRCIGASRAQIVRFVRLEALNWCKSAIPAGCFSGMAVCWGLCALLRFVVRGEFVEMPLFAVSVSGILSGIAVGLITVLLAAQSPARAAARVSPIAAVSGGAQNLKTFRHGANTRLFKVETALGFHHAVAARKNLFLMTGSFALTIVLFLVFSACLDIVRKLIPSETSFSPDVGIVSEDNDNSIEKGLAGELCALPGVKNAFGTMYAMRLPVRIDGRQTAIDLMSYEDFMFASTEKSVTAGSLSEIYGDSDYALAIFSQDSRLGVGDKIEIGDNLIEIACVASEGIGSVSGCAVAVCSEETFQRLMGEQGYMMINVILEKGAPEQTVEKIRTLSGSHVFTDRREDKTLVHGTYWVLRIAVYGFLAIISFITVLNIMNSISMGVSARIKQYGAMRAVGMESRQVRRMIGAEALTCAFCGTAVGLVLGLALHCLIYVTLMITHFGGTWQIPLDAIVLVLLLVAVSCAAAVYAPAKRIQDMAVTAAINEL